MKNPFKLLTAALALGAALQAPLVQAQQYPTKPIRVIVPFAPGGGTDFIGRFIAQRMSATIGQQVIVENKPGAGGNVGADLVAKSPPDGQIGRAHV